METFWRQGYEATSVQDLVQSTGINRGSMYDTFGSKHELFVEALKTYSEAAVANARQVLSSDEHSSIANIHRYFSEVANMFYGQEVCIGCLLTNTAVELAQHNPEIADLLKKKFISLDKAFRETLERAVAAGEVPSSTNLNQLAAFLLLTMQGAGVSAKAGASRKSLQESFEIALSSIPTQAS